VDGLGRQLSVGTQMSILKDVGILLEEFPRGSLKIESMKDGYLLSLASGKQVKEYRFVDALGLLWIATKDS